MTDLVIRQYTSQFYIRFGVGSSFLFLVAAADLPLHSENKIIRPRRSR